jgi:single-strand DNA-binding protein
MNTVILLGRLTADPDIRSTRDGKAVASFTLAVDRYKEGADFIRCQAWEKRAEFCEKYLKKGTKIAIRGRIRTGDYTDKDGKKVYTTDVVIEDIEFAQTKAAQAAQEAPEPKPDENGFMDIPDNIGEELPFN